METKPGTKTTELWFSIALICLAIIGAGLGMIPNDYVVEIMKYVGAGYAISRGIAKHGIKPSE